MDDAEVASHRARGIDVSGWSFDEERPEVLRLFVTDYRGVAPSPSLSATAIEQDLGRLKEFYEHCRRGYGERLEESSKAFELAEIISRQGPRFEQVHLYLFSDGRARDPVVKDYEADGVRFVHHIWDLERLHRLDSSGQEHEPISVDVVGRLGGPLPCLVGPAEKDHQVLLAIVPGTFLAELYGELGSRVLERNVRAFLQIRGAVNRGIRRTLQEEPDRFLAYNNGISATASKVSFADLSDTGVGIGGIEDFQVVNGGQTVASIHSAMKKDHVDVSTVRVQMKLTVVGDDHIDELVPFISKYSNTQNKVTGADFSSNTPYHVRLEALSRSTWAPAADGSQRQTHWFYERARGQYADHVTRARTPAKQREFKQMNPPQQMFTKTDLAKFVNSWAQVPYLVSLGAEKNFREFQLQLEEQGTREPEREDFERIIALAILFRTTEKIVSAQRFGGYRANIVAYTIAKLANATAQRIDLGHIWRAQSLTPALHAAIAELSHPVNDAIQDPRGTTHVGEWTKKLDCWRLIQEREWELPTALRTELLELGTASSAPQGSAIPGAGPTAAQADAMTKVGDVPAETWFALANWAKVTDNLTAFDRRLAFGLGQTVGRGRPLSPRQSVQGLRMLEEASRLGFER